MGMSLINLQTLQFVNENSPLGDSDALPDSLLFYFAGIRARAAMCSERRTRSSPNLSRFFSTYSKWTRGARALTRREHGLGRARPQSPISQRDRSVPSQGPCRVGKVVMCSRRGSAAAPCSRGCGCGHGRRRPRCALLRAALGLTPSSCRDPRTSGLRPAKLRDGWRGELVGLRGSEMGTGAWIGKMEGWE
jgi:hypothetical protein